ncbi:MAG: HIT family protein [Pseudodesulfovibrio sp.]|uniref:Histidine triad (HIT) protein n=1 Tax=Pseudodesulfovibrio aespoeensis (strain ATCC 700646 / DSM 10631 / Aspo-2) TaxID=643562 RepID=E6VR71_PSEA9|nr:MULTISPECIES: HIT family protein [Pseudodesulfovibrio]MBU4191567.1 HIT family protein [Pseudomonadota bacterium]ADU64155.1 histidine triad (HIT) protein [Pseudodesulfovibrio aespoeensis Aspo-2]MBU4245177.1 HIT family protein [Pseudomonadota bacterium]MBU4378777.1 HIT family protein [Pseudomonadota bacterium]MBU4475475.1 HIT family protein [Pseudomonadota bacterium]
MTPRDKDCIFCKIVAGAIPCAKVFETEHCLAFLDIAPVHPGHVLVMPKGHYATLMDIPAELGADLTATLSRVGKAVMEATAADGLNLMQNNFEAAGQVVHHAHFHLIPRHAGDGLTLWPQSGYESSDEMSGLAKIIAGLLK